MGEKIRDQIIPYSFQERLKTHFEHIFYHEFVY